jgi:uncharacterized protein YegJ (DUF2314 family)
MNPKPLIVVVCLAITACSRPAADAGTTVHREGEPAVTQVSGEDREMNAAMERARSTLGDYDSRHEDPPASQSYLGIKVRFEADDAIEHMWVDEVEITGDGYRGRLANEPMQITSLKAGDPVTFTRPEVSDWMAVDDGRLVGGFTLRVMRNRMSEEERAAFDAETDFRID